MNPNLDLAQRMVDADVDRYLNRKALFAAYKREPGKRQIKLKRLYREAVERKHQAIEELNRLPAAEQQATLEHYVTLRRARGFNGDGTVSVVA